ncbi:hypothetical protein, partial [Rhodoblastus sp.]|uniref:hypothetical protein n=1 Tax=Rhodoblastus sp. TaxID=1962975 RepID=UPI003F95BF08
ADVKTSDPSANLVANLGADWWLNPSAAYVASGANNPGAGSGDWVKLTTSYQSLYFTTLTAAQLTADPPPGLASTTTTTGTTTSTSTTGTTTTATTPAAPTVAITSAGGTVTVADPLISGTVDVADAGSTVTILDGKTKIGTATVAANGTWSDEVTLTGQGGNVVTATDTNAGGTGTSNAVTYTLTSATTPPVTTPPVTTSATTTAPTCTMQDSALTVTGGGGEVGLGVTNMTSPSSATDATLTIKGLPRYESITDGLGDKFHGSSITRTEAQLDSGLTLTSHYRGSQHPVATLTLTASDTVGGATVNSASQSIVVTDPPPVSSATTSKLALLNQFAASGFENDWKGAPSMANGSSQWADQNGFLTSPHH